MTAHMCSCALSRLTAISLFRQSLKIVRTAIAAAGIDPDGRKQGPHAFRSSLASSMVNDNIPYEVVRKTLGHTDQNAIRSYARLDLEQLRGYALPVMEAAGTFAAFLEGRCSLL